MAPRVAWPQQGSRVVVEAALTGGFDRLPHRLVLALVAGELADGNLLHLITKCLQAGVREHGVVRPTRQGTPPGGGIAPLLANIVLNHLAWRLEALGDNRLRDADDFVGLGKTQRQAAKALGAVTACVEEALGVALNPDKTPLTTVAPGGDFLGDHVTARTMRMGGQAEERVKMKLQDLTRRRHHLDAAGGRQGNRVLRGTVRDVAAACTTCRGQFNELDRWIRRRLRGMQYTRIGQTDHRRVKSRHLSRMGVVRCRAV